MDPLGQQTVELLKNDQCQQLIKSLSTMRVEESSDITLVCGERDFFAHKVVLQASSHYFRAMFGVGMHESESRHVLFNDISPNTMDAILDFIYLGSVGKIQTARQFQDVLIASHLLQVQGLYQFCRNALKALLSLDNFFDIFYLSFTYDLDAKSEFLYFWFHNSEKLVTTNSFLALNSGQVKELLVFLKSHSMNLDAALMGLSSWMKYDTNERKESVLGLLDYVDPRLLSKDCIRLALIGKDLMGISLEVTNRMNELLVPALATDDCPPVDNPHLKAKSNCETRIIFFSTKCKVDVYNAEDNCTALREFRYENCIQQFDIESMSWLPLQPFDYNCATAAMFQYKDYLCIVGGDYKIGIMYNVFDNCLKPFPCDMVNDKINAAACYFKSNFYVIGGTQFQNNIEKHGNWVSTTSVYYTEPGSGVWQQASACKSIHTVFARMSALTSSRYIYLVGCYPYPQKDITVQYNSGPDKGRQWESIHVRSERQLLSGNNFFVFRDTLHALFVADGYTFLLSYDHCTRKMETKRYVGCPVGVIRVNRVYVTEQTPCLLVSADEEQFEPTLLWDPQTGEWITIPAPSGRRQIPYACNSFLYTF